MHSADKTSVILKAIKAPVTVREMGLVGENTIAWLLNQHFSHKWYQYSVARVVITLINKRNSFHVCKKKYNILWVDTDLHFRSRNIFQGRISVKLHDAVSASNFVTTNFWIRYISFLR
jgi:hypothetical protein